jgi:transcriptional regulator with XRE-family HTH domain
MCPDLILQRLGAQIRSRRLARGHTQAALAVLAGLPRQKIVAMERGDRSVSMGAYARALAGLDSELQVITAVMPTLDDVHGLFD